MIKKKGFLPKNAELDLQIIFCMINKSKPMLLSDIANNISVPRQKIAYHIPSLIKNGLILPMKNKRYVCQPLFYKQDVLMKSMLEPLVIQLVKHLSFEYSVDKEETIANFLRFLLAYWSIEI